MTVSEIRTRGDRAEVLFDDGTKLQSTKKTALDFGLAKGSKLTDGEYAALCAASSKALARLRATAARASSALHAPPSGSSRTTASSVTSCAIIYVPPCLKPIILQRGAPRQT